MPSKHRRAYETGHRPKFLVVIDGTPESVKAVHFASRRVARTGANLVMLAVAAQPANFEWIGIGEALREEAHDKAETLLAEAAAKARTAAGVEPECVLRDGDRADQLIKLINEDEDISFLVLAAGQGKEGPGPLIAAVTGKNAATFPIPVVIVPSALSDEEIDAIAG